MKFAGDSPDIHTRQGFVYLATVIDWMWLPGSPAGADATGLLVAGYSPFSGPGHSEASRTTVAERV